MIVISSATSNTGSAVARALLARRQQVRVLGRSRGRLQPFAERGADAVAVDPTDSRGLRRAFADATAVFVMLAPGVIPDSVDVRAHQKAVIDAYAAALADLPDLRRAVVLSGWAANYDGARGPVWGLRRLEEAVGSALQSVPVTALRPGWFMENALPMIDDIRRTGAAHGLIPGSLPLPMIATSDIGAVAADLLTGAREHDGVLELQGPADRTLDDITAVIGAAVGVTGVRYERISASRMCAGLEVAGFSAHMAEGVTLMTGDVAEQRIVMLHKRDESTSTPAALGDLGW
jgi:uncharacterized protein YbjT (DUF2867 family)